MTAAIIARCVRHCANARDGRGRWRIEREAHAELLASGSTETVAAMTAAAARRLGEWLHERGEEVVRELELCALWDAAA